MPESPGNGVEELLERALDLHARGRDDEAKDAYLDVLRRDAGHFGALNNLGTLLLCTGYRSAARTAYRQAVAHHPENVMGRVNFGNALYDGDALYQAREQYEAALAVDAQCELAHQGLAYVLEKLGDERAAAEHRERGFRGHAVVLAPYRGEGTAIAVLLLVSARGGNVNTDRFLDDRTFFVTKLFADFYDPTAPVPFHSFVFNAIGDAELCHEALEGARLLLQRTNAPIINPPGGVLETSRVRNAERLGRLTGVVAPKTRLFARDELEDPNAANVLDKHGFTWPLLLRTPGFHTGQHFVMVETPERLRDALADLPGSHAMAIEHLDARGPDGNVRKYRVMIVDGRLYPLHLAIAPRWKVHYYTADMESHPEHRAEEAAFLDDMQSVLGAGAVAALERIASELGLDYAGIDFGLDSHRRILLFEANATMLVPAPEIDPRWAYRRAPLERILAAVRSMLSDRQTASVAG